MTERFKATKKLVDEEIAGNTIAGKEFLEKMAKKVETLTRGIGRLTDKQGYLDISGGWIRVTRSGGFSVQEAYEAGCRPGGLSKMKAALRDYFH